MVINGLYIYNNNNLLVGGLEHFLFGGFDFFHILGLIIPTDEYFSEGLKPPTSLILGEVPPSLKPLWL